MDRAAARRGGLVGVGLGVPLLALSLFFLVRGPQEPGEELGFFLPLVAAGLLRSELPWTAFGIAPLLAAAGLLKDSGRVSRLGQRSAS